MGLRHVITPIVLSLLLFGCGKSSNNSQTDTPQAASTATRSAPQPAPVKQSDSVLDTPAAFRRSLEEDENALLLDVRTPEEVSTGAIKGASFINIGDPGFETKVSALQKDKTIYVYCLVGGRSARAAKILASKGYEVHDLKGGITAWKSAGLPVEEGSAPPPAATERPLTVEEYQKRIAEKSVTVTAFKTAWCTPCREMVPVIEAVQESLGTVEEDTQLIELNWDAQQVIAQAEKIEGVPVFVRYEHGQEAKRHSGKMTEAELLDFVQP